jgi:hypothetical protein|tara:strand:- start:741 stop:923 length:183 start_codon:yes stop_codon:yes gene_type:complete
LRYPNFNYLGDQMFRILPIAFVSVSLAAYGGSGGGLEDISMKIVVIVGIVVVILALIFGR